MGGFRFLYLKLPSFCLARSRIRWYFFMERKRGLPPLKEPEKRQRLSPTGQDSPSSLTLPPFRQLSMRQLFLCDIQKIDTQLQHKRTHGIHHKAWFGFLLWVNVSRNPQITQKTTIPSPYPPFEELPNL